MLSAFQHEILAPSRTNIVCHEIGASKAKIRHQNMAYQAINCSTIAPVPDTDHVPILLDMPQSLIIDLHISADEYLRHYRGSVNKVICTARDGRKVQFPSGVLQRFVTRDGIHGTFRLQIDDNNKLVGVERVGV